jgi:hypothetical protein
LGWLPTLTFDELVKLMVDADVSALSDGAQSDSQSAQGA